MTQDRYIDELLKHIIPLQQDILDDEHGRNDVCPSVGKVLGRLLYTLVLGLRPKQVLEIGTSSGYAAIWLGLALKEVGGQLTTIESQQRLVDEARHNLEKAGLSETVQVICAQAEDVLPDMEGPFDIIFQDAGTRCYPDTLFQVIRLLKKGGMLLADDIFYALHAPRKMPRENMLAFNQALFQHQSMFSTLVPFHDGLSMSIKK